MFARFFAVAGMSLLLATNVAGGSPLVAAGDALLRHDIQRLADLGVIRGTVTSWPLAWGPIAADIRNYDRTHALPRDAIDAIARVLARASWEMRTDEFTFNARVALAEKPTRIRSFADSPREKAGVSLGASLTTDLF
ncbi:MAG: hypothetical protein KJO31_14645, partial [Gammaproteobacteria bacterium]|nr:hypothetical protein [Gammaproteobacteria bacterium]